MSEHNWLDEVFISDPNILLNTDKNGDTIMPDQAKEQILTHHEAELEAIIGEDIKVKYIKSIPETKEIMEIYYGAQNYLKAEQRLKAKAFIERMGS